MSKCKFKRKLHGFRGGIENIIVASFMKTFDQTLFKSYTLYKNERTV